MRQFISAVAVAGAVGQVAAAQTGTDLAQCVKALPAHFNGDIVSCQVGPTVAAGCLCKLSKTSNFQEAVAKNCASVNITPTQMSTYLCSLDGSPSSSSAAPAQSSSTSAVGKSPLGGRPMAPPTGSRSRLGDSHPMIPANVNGHVKSRRGFEPNAMPISEPQGDSQSQGFDVNGFGVHMGGDASHSGSRNAGGLAHLHGDVQPGVEGQASSSSASGFAYAQSSSAAAAAPSSAEYSATPSSNGLQHIHFGSPQSAYSSAASSASSFGYVAMSEAPASASSSASGYQHLGSSSASSSYGNFGDFGSGYASAASPSASVAAASSSSDAFNHLFSVYANAASSVTPIAASSYAMQSSGVAAFAASSSVAASSSGQNGLLHNNPFMSAPTAAIPSSDAAAYSSDVHMGADGFKTQVVTETVTMCGTSSSGVPFAGSNGPVVPINAASGSSSAPMGEYTPSPTPTPAQSTGVSPFPLFQGAGVKGFSASKGLATAAAGAFMALLILL